MPIELRPKGEAALYAEAGKVLGQAEAKRKQQVINTELAAQKISQEWELEKMRLRSQQDFEQELRLRQAQLNAEARAQEWQVEKMELASRLDFEQQEKERLRRKQTFNSGVETIDNNQGLSNSQKNMAKFLLAAKYTDIEEAAPYLGLKPQEEDILSTLKSQLGGEATAKEQQQQQIQQEVLTGNKVPMRNKAGEVAYADKEDVVSMKESGYEIIGNVVPKSSGFQYRTNAWMGNIALSREQIIQDFPEFAQYIQRADESYGTNIPEKYVLNPSNKYGLGRVVRLGYAEDLEQYRKFGPDSKKNIERMSSFIDLWNAPATDIFPGKKATKYLRGLGSR